MKKNNIFMKLREDRGARAIAITVTLMLLILTVIIVTTVIANRAASNRLEDPFSEPAGVTDPDGETPEEPDDGEDGDGEKPDDSETNAIPSHFMLPVDGVLQKAHHVDVQVFSDTMKDYRMHAGIDIGTVAGASVSAMADGVVAQVWDDLYMGKCIAVAHGKDVYTIYKNLANELPDGIVIGAAVKAGDKLGTVGESAMVEVGEEPHLHLEMTVGGLAVDPTDYLDDDAMANLGEDTNYEDAS